MTADERERLTGELLPLARRMAKGVAAIYPRAELEELFSDACLGVVRALDRFDPARGVPLRVFARQVIAGAIYNGIRDRDPISENARRTIRRAEERVQTLAASGVESSVEALAHEMPELRAALTASQRLASTVSLESDASDELEPAATEYDPAAIVQERQERHELIGILSELPENERRVLSMYYFADMAPKYISQAMSLTVQRVYQLHRSGLDRLRARIPA